MAAARQTEPEADAEAPKTRSQPLAVPMGAAPPAFADRGQILMLQASAGNQAVARMLTARRVGRGAVVARDAVAYQIREVVERAAGPSAAGGPAPVGGTTDDPNFNPWTIVHDIRRAINQSDWETKDDNTFKRNVNFKKLVEVLEPLTPEQVERIKRIYEVQEKTSLENDLFLLGQSGVEANLTEDQKTRLRVLLKGAGAKPGEGTTDTKLQADAVELYQLIKGDLDETKRERIMSLHRRPVEEIAAMDRHYEGIFQAHPGDDLSRKLGKLDEYRVLFLRKGEIAKADALAIEEKRAKLDALQKGKNAFTDEDDYQSQRKKLIDGITGVLELNRQEAAAGKTGPEAEKAVQERLGAILTMPLSASNRTLGDEVTETLKGTAGAGRVLAITSGSLAKVAAAELVEMEARKTTHTYKIMDIFKRLRKQGEADALASIPTLSPEQKQALVDDPIVKRDELVDQYASKYFKDFFDAYEKQRPSDGRSWEQIFNSASEGNQEVLGAMVAGAGELDDIQEMRFAVRKKDPELVKEVLRRQGTRERVQKLEEAYNAKYDGDLRTLIFGAQGPKAAMGLLELSDITLETLAMAHPSAGAASQQTRWGIAKGRDAAQIAELLDGPSAKDIGGVGEAEHIAAGGALEVTVTEANSGFMGGAREIGDDPDTQKMMNASNAQLTRLAEAFKANADNPRLQAAILADMKKVRATLSGDAAAYEEENERMRDQLRAAVSLVVQIALAVALPGAGAGVLRFIASTALNIGASVASNMLIYGEKYDLNMLYSDVVGGGLGALGGKFGEDLAKMAAGGAAKGTAKAAADLGVASNLAGDAAAASKMAADGARDARAFVEAAVSEGGSIVGSTAGTSVAMGQNQFAIEGFLEEVLMNRAGNIRGGSSGGGDGARPAPGGPAVPAGEGAHADTVPPAPGTASRPAGEAPVRPPGDAATRTHPETPAPPGASGDSTRQGAEGVPGRRPSEAQRAEGHALWQNMEQLGSQWNDLNPAERRHELSNVANNLLAGHGVPAIGTSHDPPKSSANKAEFDFKKWAIRLSPEIVNKKPLTSKDVAEITEVIRHELEHALQWWSMARLQATKSATPNEVVNAMKKIDPEVANLAFESIQTKPMSAAEQAAAQAIWDNVYAPGSQRNAQLNQRTFYAEQVQKLAAEIKAAQDAGQPVDPAKVQQLEGAFNIYQGLEQIYRSFPEEIPAYAAGGTAKHQAHTSHMENEIALAEVAVREVSDDLDQIEQELQANEDVYLEQVAAGSEDPALRAEHGQLIEDQKNQMDALTRVQTMLLQKRQALDQYLNTGELPAWWGEKAAPREGEPLGRQADAGAASAGAGAGAAARGNDPGSDTGPAMPGASTGLRKPSVGGDSHLTPRQRREINAVVARVDFELFKRNLNLDSIDWVHAKRTREWLREQPDPAQAARDFEQFATDWIRDYDIQMSRELLEGRHAPTELDPIGGESPELFKRPEPGPGGIVDPKAMQAWVKENGLDQPLELGGAIRYGPLDGLGRPTGIKATLRPEEIAGGTRGEFKPPGYESGENHARGHLLGRQLGGSGTDPRNIAVLYHNGANTPVMRNLENMVRKAVDAGDTVDYQIIPVYRGDSLMPVGVTIIAQGKTINIEESVLNIPLGETPPEWKVQVPAISLPPEMRKRRPG